MGVAALAITALASGCGLDGAPSGSVSVSGSSVKSAPGQQNGGGPQDVAARQRAERQAVVAAAKRWGLKTPPLTPPAPPAKKPVITTRDGFEVDGHVEEGLPPVFTTIPTREKVVFLTIDDGAEKDPEFLRMMSELKVPYTAFISDYLVKEDYAHFKDMQARGVVLNNHTLDHPYLPGLSYEQQKQEICGMQDVIDKRYGKRPVLFRPPFGNYNKDTLVAAKACGITHAPLWNEEVFVDHWEYREWDRDLHPGDIVLSHFRGRDDWEGTMPDMIRLFLDKVTEKGYAVGRLEDYL
ncbi:polysaccharide deacetylase family protein [Streptomyces sp. NPDC059477]|uniref:polysaccharide deacetylase family protein n=1 Tax=Streptomyces sp. NPDC059477 TaxID=3346847 RepID=UPI0036CD43A0